MGTTNNHVHQAAREIATGYRGQLCGPGEIAKDPSKSHPLAFRAIRLSERMAMKIRNGEGDHLASDADTQELLEVSGC